MNEPKEFELFWRHSGRCGVIELRVPKQKLTEEQIREIENVIAVAYRTLTKISRETKDGPEYVI